MSPCCFCNRPCLPASVSSKHHMIVAIVRLGTLEARKWGLNGRFNGLIRSFWSGSTFLGHKTLYPSKDPRRWGKLAIEVANGNMERWPLLNKTEMPRLPWQAVYVGRQRLREVNVLERIYYVKHWGCSSPGLPGVSDWVWQEYLVLCRIKKSSDGQLWLEDSLMSLLR